MDLQQLLNQIVRVKDRRILGKNHSAILLAISLDGSVGYLRVTKTGTLIRAEREDIKPTPFGLEMAQRYQSFRTRSEPL